MNDLQWYDIMRMLTALFLIGSSYRLMKIAHRDYQKGKTYSQQLKEFVWLVFGFFFVLILGALEALAKNADYRYTALLSFTLSLAALRATRYTEEKLRNE